MVGGRKVDDDGCWGWWVMVCICWWLVVVWLVVDGGWLMVVCGLGAGWWLVNGGWLVEVG